MHYFEKKFIIHRDLATRNCLIDDYANRVKMSDFGMARIISSSSSMIYEEKYDKPFPLRWSSPEVLIYRKYSSKYDVWSYGIVLWEIHSLDKIPYKQSISNDIIIQLIKSGHMLNKPELANHFICKLLMLPC
ncbi:unnamed protein product [Rotaria socialis]|nr:unnamed protein product [Rotaria socialis]CAF3721851.1 unnamed protein product [Rotaria socialis]CAF3753343.1 unnamed protein product [Rotaria socialis]CAF4186961.1 unnamed protein product [Rotaria socialis]CAF4200234.1 unnamed protein product [Rotaria socialis]